MQSSFAKLDRARRQIGEAKGMSTEFFGQPKNQVLISATLDPTDDHHVVRITKVPPTEDFYRQLSVVIGDAVHNLRSALDHLVYHLAELNCGCEPHFPRKTQFPICNSRRDFDQQDGTGEVAADHVEQIESFQPYNGMGSRPDSYSGPYIHPLTLLNRMSNQDKHRQLNTALAIPSGASFAFAPGARVRPTPPIRNAEELQNYMEQFSPFRFAEKRLEVGAEVLREKLEGENIPDHMPNIGTARPHVVLDDFRPLGPTLDRIYNFVELILNEFQNAD